MSAFASSSSFSTPLLDQHAAVAAKYDRQVRLWGNDGQRALSKAHIVALGATTAMVEALKNVVLTGVGSITLVDERVVQAEHLATSFFLDVQDVGSSLAECTVRHLCEMNPDCTGLALVLPPRDWVKAFASMSMARGSPGLRSPLAAYKAVMRQAVCVTVGKVSGDKCAAQLQQQPPPPTVILVSNRYQDVSGASEVVCAGLQFDIPVVCVESKGLVGYVQTHARDRVIVHTDPDPGTRLEDLRIFNPFPELQAWFEAHNPEDEVRFPRGNPDALVEHSHLPYICLLYHGFKKWAAAAVAAGSPPPHFPLQMAQFKAIIKCVEGMTRCTNPPQEGFIEAVEKCTPRLNRPFASCPPQGLQLLFDDPRCANPSQAAASVPFGSSSHVKADVLLRPQVMLWFVLNGVKQFYEASAADPAERVLPFCGYVPDFTTTTAWFQELGGIYKAKHDTDVEVVTQLAVGMIQEAVVTSQRESGTFTPSNEEPEDHHCVGGENNISVSGGSGGYSGVWGGYQIPCPLDELQSRVHSMAKAVVRNIWTVTLSQFADSDRDVYQVPQDREWRDRLGSFMLHHMRAVLPDLTALGPDGLAKRRSCLLAMAVLASHEVQRMQVNGVVPGDETAYDAPFSVAGEAHNPVLQQLKALLTCGTTCCTSGSKNGLRLAAAPATSVDEEASLQAAPAENETSTAVCSSLHPLWEEESWWVDNAQLASEACWEVVRPGGSELPSVAATVGALASQETIKLVQQHRVPLTDPVVYDGYANTFYKLIDP